MLTNPGAPLFCQMHLHGSALLLQFGDQATSPILHAEGWEPSALQCL